MNPQSQPGDHASPGRLGPLRGPRSHTPRLSASHEEHLRTILEDEASGISGEILRSSSIVAVVGWCGPAMVWSAAEALVHSTLRDVL